MTDARADFEALTVAHVYERTFADVLDADAHARGAVLGQLQPAEMVEACRELRRHDRVVVDENGIVDAD